MSFVAAILILSLLIFVHELGHFLVAKLCGVGVLEFAIGFGPKLISKTVGETAYSFRAIPLGGYVKMVGESLQEDAELRNELSETEIEKYSFSRKNYFQKFAVVLAGPMFNLIFAFFIGALAYYTFGASEPSNQPIIGQVIEGLPAAKAGLQADDKILAVNDVQVRSWEDLAKEIGSSDGSEINLTVSRDDKELSILVTGEKEKIEEAVLRGDSEASRVRIGIVTSIDRVPVDAIDSFKYSALQIAGITVMTGRGLYAMVSGIVSANNIAGPLFIVNEAAKSAKKGLEYVFDFIVLISVSLALLNLLPIPVLDGGHLVIFTIEAIIRRPIGLKVQGIAMQIGFMLLMLLTFFAIGNDIKRLFWS